MFHTVSVPNGVCSTQCLFHAVSVPPRVCSTQRLFHTESVPHSVCSTQCLFHTVSVPPRSKYVSGSTLLTNEISTGNNNVCKLMCRILTTCSRRIFYGFNPYSQIPVRMRGEGRVLQINSVTVLLILWLCILLEYHVLGDIQSSSGDLKEKEKEKVNVKGLAPSDKIDKLSDNVAQSFQDQRSQQETHTPLQPLRGEVQDLETHSQVPPVNDFHDPKVAELYETVDKKPDSIELPPDVVGQEDSPQEPETEQVSVLGKSEPDELVDKPTAAPYHPPNLQQQNNKLQPEVDDRPPPQVVDPLVTPPILQEEEVEKQQEEKYEPTPQEIEAERLYQSGEKLINATYYKDYKEAYQYFVKAAQLNHLRAKEYVAFGYLFGDYLNHDVAKAADMFEEMASKGSPKAQMGLSFMFSSGLHYNSSQAKALIYTTFGALGGDPLAQMALGYRYYAGIGVESKCETALTYYRKVATKVADSVTLAGGPVVQRIRLQEETESQGVNNSPVLDDDLLQYYHFLADKGDQQAQIVLGTLYYQGGKGVQINHEQAYHYFSTAAEAGNGHAMGYLGKMHSEGSPFVKQSNTTAYEYFKKSAEKNNHIGQAGLGLMYLNGLGVEKDTNKAFRYFSLASDQGSVDGQLQLGIMYFSGIGVRKDYKMAVKYFTMASQNGHVLAFFNLAQMHATGTGVLRNCHTAVELFKNVAERGRWSEMMMDAHRMYHEGSVDTALIKYMFLAELGYEVAQSNVAFILDNGVTDKFNRHESYQRALLQYSRAASQGSTHAILKMGDYHYYGHGTEVDYESAASHYRMASEQQHNAQAMFNLGYMHEKGLGLKQDIHLAKRFYDLASETSIDAHIPVTLALFKLGLFYGMDVFNKEFEGVYGLLGMLDPVNYFGPEWDLYLASILAILCGIVYFLRRNFIEKFFNCSFGVCFSLLGVLLTVAVADLVKSERMFFFNILFSVISCVTRHSCMIRWVILKCFNTCVRNL
ncbi:Protein sel-1 1 [Bulinus truncatus]|nr:Protein sel-1 1 [Bulinus truncatus]